MRTEVDGALSRPLAFVSHAENTLRSYPRIFDIALHWITSRVVVALACIPLLTACPGEPSPVLVTRIELPSGTAPAVVLDSAKLHLIENGYSAYSDPTPASVARASGNGFDLRLRVGIGPRVEVKLHVWYDLNGNGIEDHGDAAGDLSPSPFTAVDNNPAYDKTIGRDINLAPPITLRLIP